jgi:hypothetical protein
MSISGAIANYNGDNSQKGLANYVVSNADIFSFLRNNHTLTANINNRMS